MYKIEEFLTNNAEKVLKLALVLVVLCLSFKVLVDITNIPVHIGQSIDEGVGSFMFFIFFWLVKLVILFFVYRFLFKKIFKK